MALNLDTGKRFVAFQLVSLFLPENCKKKKIVKTNDLLVEKEILNGLFWLNHNKVCSGWDSNTQPTACDTNALADSATGLMVYEVYTYKAQYYQDLHFLII